MTARTRLLACRARPALCAAALFIVLAGLLGMHGLGDHGMPGTELAHASGADFDRMFLQGMITHHRGALTMAQDEINKGKNTDAIALAKRIKTSQAKEISLMRRMLAS